MNKKDVTPRFKSLVHSLISKTEHAKMMRKEVDKIQRKALQQIELYNDLDVKLEGQERKRIFDPDMVYLSQDKEGIQAYDELCDQLERNAGLKPDNMEFDYCPALVAERKRTEAEWDVFNEMSKIIDLGYEDGELNNKLLCGTEEKQGLELRKEFLDLCIKLVVNK